MATSAKTRCTGACCAVFYLPHTIRNLRRKVGTLEDGAYIADMVIPLTVEEARERAARFGAALHAVKRRAGHYFTCRHWDEETRRCTAYRDRPKMCREFPYGEPCGLGVKCCYVLPPKQLAVRIARLAEKEAISADA